MGFYLVAVVLQQDTTHKYTTHITHHAQTKRSTQGYSNNKGHNTHSEYYTKKKRERKEKQALCYKPEGRGFETRWICFNLHNPSGGTMALGLLSL
jgi:hypothetical protein